jgi:hypothetical protein
MMTTTKQMTEKTPAFERGTRYLIRIRKDDGFAPFSVASFLRHIFQSLQRTPIEDTSMVLINAPRYLYLTTTHIHPADAPAILNACEELPETEVYPIVEDIEQGDPYRRYLICVATFPRRKTARLPKVAQLLKHYRWVAFERGDGIEGILISEEPPVVPYPCSLTTEAYLITASDEEGEIRYRDLRGYEPDFTTPLLHSC